MKYIRAFHGVALPRFPGRLAGLYLKAMLAVLNKCVHVYIGCSHHNTNFSQIWISVPIPHDLVHLCVFFVFYFYFRKRIRRSGLKRTDITDTYICIYIQHMICIHL